jgi:hypothetical protein
VKPVPSGEGLVVRRVRLAEQDVVLLGAILHGEDHLASIHGEPVREGARVIVSVMTTRARAGELDAWLGDLARELGLELVGEKN